MTTPRITYTLLMITAEGQHLPTTGYSSFTQVQKVLLEHSHSHPHAAFVLTGSRHRDGHIPQTATAFFNKHGHSASPASRNVVQDFYAWGKGKDYAGQ